MFVVNLGMSNVLYVALLSIMALLKKLWLEDGQESGKRVTLNELFIAS